MSHDEESTMPPQENTRTGVVGTTHLLHVPGQRLAKGGSEQLTFRQTLGSGIPKHPSVGPFVGVCVGWNVGFAVGSNVGALLGCDVGLDDGKDVGAIDGDAVQKRLQ